MALIPGCIGFRFLWRFYTAASELLALFDKPGGENTGEVTLGGLDLYLGVGQGGTGGRLQIEDETYWLVFLV